MQIVGFEMSDNKSERDPLRLLKGLRYPLKGRGNKQILFVCDPIVFTIAMESAHPYCPRASLTIPSKNVLVLIASFPPLSRSPFADEMASEATCGKASGLDSKMTIRTPMGTVFWTRSRVSETLVCLTILPTMLWLASAIWKKFKLQKLKPNCTLI